MKSKMVKITEDATLYNGWVQLNYRPWGLGDRGSALPLDRFSFDWRLLKKGTKVKIFYRGLNELDHIEMVK